MATPRSYRVTTGASGCSASPPADLVPRLNYDLAVTVEGIVVGAARLHHVAVGSAEGEIGYLLRREVWGAGIATETARLLLAFGFDVLGLEQVRATADRRNVSSRRVLEKCGMRVAPRTLLTCVFLGRAGGIRTRDLLTPSQAR